VRIISGSQKGRRIYPPANLPVRPTTDMAKEGLFNILNNIIDFENLIVLDLFAGTGNISLEFASRGAASITSVDLNFKCVDFIKKISREIGIETVKPVRFEVFRFLKSAPKSYDLIFADPPYDLDGIELLPELIFEKEWLNKNAWLIIEHPKGIDFAGHRFFSQKRNYGKVNFTFFTRD
jgi:16S rRNA (guanine(966)-N(2))-methyltransferase RsmD